MIDPPIFFLFLALTIFWEHNWATLNAAFIFNLVNNSEINDNVKADQNKAPDIVILKDIDSTNSTIQKKLETKDSDKSTKISSLDNNLNKADQKTIKKKIDKQDNAIKESEGNKDIKSLQNKKPKSNFIWTIFSY